MAANPAPIRTAYISFSAEINPTTTEQLIAAAANFVGQGFGCLYFLFSTPGGGVMNGMNIYNVLRGLPARKVFHNVGNVDSLGNVIFLAGDERFACRHSTFMFHGVGADVKQGARLEEKNAQEILGNILADQRRMADIIVERTNINAAEAADLF